ncbi:MAG: Mov34/MPN/PAD-1 family protein [Promethearchaeota archaeon]
MKYFNISSEFLEAIKNQALSNENEIYGWLIGYQKNDISNVLAVFECKRFEHQTLISAVPDAQEFQELSFVLPQGIGPIGIYHSHPFSSEIFHSHTDDSTLISLSKQFPQCVSIVTNGQQINYYQMGKESKTQEIKMKSIEPNIPRFLSISMKESLVIKLQQEEINNSIKRNNVKIKIINKIREFFEQCWEDMVLFHKHRLLKKNEIIKPYLVNSIHEEPIFIKIPDHYKIHKRDELLIESTNKDYKNELISFNLMIKTTIPIYITEENKKYEEISQLVKTEFISNNILQKIYNSIIDIESTQILVPEDCFLNYFGFYIKLISFNNEIVPHNNLKKSTNEFLTKFLSFFEIFSNMKMDVRFKNKILTFLNDFKNSNKIFNWDEKIITQVLIIEKEMNFKSE